MCLSPFLPVGCTLQQLIRTSTKHAVVAAVVADNDDGDEDEGYADEDDRDEEDGDEDGDEMVTRRL